MFIYTVDNNNFYNFGVSAGDAQLQRVDDDGSSPFILLSTPFRFFGTPESILYVSQLCTYFHVHTDMFQLHSNWLQIAALMISQAYA